MIKNRKMRFHRLAVPIILGLALAFATPWDAFQMESSFGQARAAEEGDDIPPYWLTDPAPVTLAGRSDLPALRAVTYNLHSGLGPDWRPFASRAEVEGNLRAIARRIAEAAPLESPADVVGLNEVDFRSRRSGWINQAEFMAVELHKLTGHRYSVVEGETWRRDAPGLEVRYGNAVLVRHPLLGRHACQLGGDCELEAEGFKNPAGGLLSRVLGEKRGVVRVRIAFHGRPVDILVTHLEAFVLKQREEQAAEMVRRFVRPGVSTILLGDTNAVPSGMTAGRPPFGADRTHDILTSGKLIDARVRVAAGSGARDLSAWSTWPAGRPQWPLDAIFATADLSPQTVAVVGGEESDHRGLLVNYGWLAEQGALDQAAWHDTMRRRQFEQILARDFHAPETRQASRAGWLARATGFGSLAAELMPKEPPVQGI